MPDVINVGTDTGRNGAGNETMDYYCNGYFMTSSYYKLCYTSKHHVWVNVRISTHILVYSFSLEGTLYEPIDADVSERPRYWIMDLSCAEQKILSAEQLKFGYMDGTTKKVERFSDESFLIKAFYTTKGPISTIPLKINGVVHHKLKTLIAFVMEDFKLMDPYMADSRFGASWKVVDKVVFKRLVLACARHVYETMPTISTLRMSEWDRAEVALCSVNRSVMENFAYRSGLKIDTDLFLVLKEFYGAEQVEEVFCGQLPPSARRFIHNARCHECSAEARARIRVLGIFD